MGNAFLLDTNVVIYFLKGRLAANDMQMIEKVIHDSLNISVITQIELLCWKTITTEESITIEKFLSYANIFYLDEPLTERVITIRKKFGLKLPDSIIAATALQNSFNLISGDKEFLRINELNNIQIQHL